MNTLAKWLGAWLALGLFIIGFAQQIPGPTFLPPSWQVLMRLLTEQYEWLWPGSFVFAGALCFIGVFSIRTLIVGFASITVIFVIWGLVSLYNWHTDAQGSIPGSVVYFMLSGAMVIIAIYTYKNRDIEEKVARVEEKEIAIREVMDELVTAR